MITLAALHNCTDIILNHDISGQSYAQVGVDILLEVDVHQLRQKSMAMGILFLRLLNQVTANIEHDSVQN